MKIVKYKNEKEKLLVTYCITSDKFLEKIYPILKENKKLMYANFNFFSKTCLNWCFEYYEKYNKAPKHHIQEIYESKKDTLKQEDQELFIEFLSYLSTKYEKENLNEQYLVDLSLLYLRETNLQILNDKIRDLLKVGKVEEAEKLMLTFSKLEQETEIKQETFVLTDIQTACNVCDFEINTNEDDRLFKLRGDLGDKLGYIYREDFFSLVGPAKRGKSYYLREVTEIACIDYGLNVIVFNLEMSHKKYLRNYYQGLSGEVKYSKNDSSTILFPYFEKNEMSGKYNIKYKEMKKLGLNSRKIKSTLKKQQIKTIGNFVVRTFPSATLTPQKILKIIDEYALQGFVPDLILIDFLDNLLIPGNEYRHTIDAKWTFGRRLAQEKHVAVGTVSHTGRKNFKQDIGTGDVNEDYRKENHITHMIALNQTPEEKEKQIMRLNIIHNRDEDSNVKQMFVALECRSIGKVLIDNLSMEKTNHFVNKKKV